jgi:hypothetical protein
VRKASGSERSTATGSRKASGSPEETRPPEQRTKTCSGLQATRAPLATIPAVMIVRLLREQQLADPLGTIPAGALGETIAGPMYVQPGYQPRATLVRWFDPYPVVYVGWENLEGLRRPPLRLALRLLEPDWSIVVGGLRQSLGWTFKILIPAVTAAAIASAVNVWVGHLLGK